VLNSSLRVNTLTCEPFDGQPTHETKAKHIQLLNRKQIVVISCALALFTLIAIMPPWRYLDGSSAGFAPIFSPPEPLADSLVTGEVASEYVPIKIVPSSLAKPGDRKTEFTSEELATPFVDVRRMLTIGTAIFLLTVVGLIAFNERLRTAPASKGKNQRKD
jgi:hypothetical protein